MVHPFRTFIEGYTSITDPDWAVVESHIERVTCRKNEWLLKEGEVCRYFYFLEEGILRFFVFVGGNDITTYFTVAPYCFTSKDSFLKQVFFEDEVYYIDSIPNVKNEDKPYIYFGYDNRNLCFYTRDVVNCKEHDEEDGQFKTLIHSYFGNVNCEVERDQLSFLTNHLLDYLYYDVVR